MVHCLKDQSTLAMLSMHYAKDYQVPIKRDWRLRMSRILSMISMEKSRKDMEKELSGYCGLGRPSSKLVTRSSLAKAITMSIKRSVPDCIMTSLSRELNQELSAVRFTFRMVRLQDDTLFCRVQEISQVNDLLSE